MTKHAVNHRQVNIHLLHEDFALLKAAADSVGVSPTAHARALLLDVLRDDAAAHGEADGASEAEAQ